MFHGDKENVVEDVLLYIIIIIIRILFNCEDFNVTYYSLRCQPPVFQLSQKISA